MHGWCRDKLQLTWCRCKSVNSEKRFAIGWFTYIPFQKFDHTSWKSLSCWRLCSTRAFAMSISSSSLVSRSCSCDLNHAWCIKLNIGHLHRLSSPFLSCKSYLFPPRFKHRRGNSFDVFAKAQRVICCPPKFEIKGGGAQKESEALVNTTMQHFPSPR